MINEIELTERIITRAFGGKTDKGGNPYCEHLYRVADSFKGTDLYTIALLHDLLEDCPEWNEKSLRCLFPDMVVNTVVILTKGKNENYFDYIQRVKECRFATQVKLADLKDNMDVTRLSELTEKDHERLDKYLKAYNILKND